MVKVGNDQEKVQCTIHFKVPVEESGGENAKLLF